MAQAPLVSSGSDAAGRAQSAVIFHRIRFVAEALKVTLEHFGGVPTATLAESPDHLRACVSQGDVDLVVVDGASAAEDRLLADLERLGAGARRVVVALSIPHRTKVDGTSVVPCTASVEEFLRHIGLTAARELPRFMLSGATRRPGESDLRDVEVRVLARLAAGDSVAEMAERLGLSRKAVDASKERTFARLGVQSSAEAIVAAIDAGVLGPEASTARRACAPLARAGRQTYQAPTVSTHAWTTDGPKVGVVHDYRLLAPALSVLLEGRAQVVSDTMWGAAAGRLADLLNPDVVIASEILADGPLPMHLPAILRGGTRVMAILDGADPGPLVDLLAAGVSGGALLDASLDELAGTAIAVAGGGVMAPPSVLSSILSEWRLRRHGGTPVDGLRLTSRELEVLDAMVDGLSTKAIARRLKIATKTVEHHKSRVFSKLDVRNQAEAVAQIRRQAL